MKHRYLTPKQRNARIMALGLARFGTKVEFAHAIDSEPRNLDNLLRADNPKLNTLIRIADALDVWVAHLIEK
ncbi:MAG: hypothetical protein WC120_05455 [Parcubacteria group bacterium]|jgi:hypothetical protein